MSSTRANPPKPDRPAAEVERRCFTLRVRPGCEQEYRRRHDEIWPELVAAMRAAGIRDMTLFMRGRQVIGTYVCDGADPEAALDAEVDARWAAYMDDVIESIDEPEPVAVWRLA